MTIDYESSLTNRLAIPGLVDAHIGPVDATRGAGGDFSETIRALIAHPDLETFFEEAPAVAEDLLRSADSIARRAYAAGDADALHQLHTALYLLYEENLRPSGTRRVFNQYNPQLIGVRNRLERHWEAFEMARIVIEPASVPVDPDAFRTYFKALCASHEMVGHRLFDFLGDAATREDLIGFFLSDAAVIVRFCDLVVMSMVGVDDEVRPELAENFWDEMGRGRFQERHVHLYRNLLEYAGVNVPGDSLMAEDFSDHLKWQGLAGYNLYLFLCLHRKNQFRSLGALGAAEMMDPDQYRKVLAGCRRVGLHDDDKLAYYTGHAEMDVAHGDGWCDNVLVPLVQRYPERRHEIVEGALMRMNITCDYFDDLFQRLSAEHREA